jgi:hypothetical protein
MEQPSVAEQSRSLVGRATQLLWAQTIPWTIRCSTTAAPAAAAAATVGLTAVGQNYSWSPALGRVNVTKHVQLSTCRRRPNVCKLGRLKPPLL